MRSHLLPFINYPTWACLCVCVNSLIDRAYFPFRNAFSWISLWKKLEDKWCVIYGVRFSFRGWVKNVEEINPLFRSATPLYHNWVLSTVVKKRTPKKKRTWKVEVNLWNGFSLSGILNRLIILSRFYSPTVLGQFICACFFPVMRISLGHERSFPERNRNLSRASPTVNGKYSAKWIFREKKGTRLDQIDRSA